MYSHRPYTPFGTEESMYNLGSLIFSYLHLCMSIFFFTFLFQQYELGAPLCGLWCTNLPNKFLTLKQSSHASWQLVEFSLPRTSLDKRVDAKVILGSMEPEVQHVAIGRKVCVPFLFRRFWKE